MSELELTSMVKAGVAGRKIVAAHRGCACVALTWFCPHMYTRYLGHLFGGQMIGGMARRSLSFDEGRGTAFLLLRRGPTCRSQFGSTKFA